MEEKVAKIVPMLKKLSEQQDIIVEGHTDNQRIHNEYFDSNWELSTARATSVARLLVDKFGLPAARMGAIGYGEYRPVVPNDTPENRAKNRRVVFFIKNAPLGGNAKVPSLTPGALPIAPGRQGGAAAAAPPVAGEEAR
jgi:chemotaxis protein MotB